MTTQTTYRQKMRREEDEIDLIQLMLYVLRRWKILLLTGVLGLILGGVFGALKGDKTLDQLDIDTLNMEQIQQYARYQQLYEDEVARQAESVYMNMDPEAVYTVTKNYYVAGQDNDLNRVSLAIGSILQDQTVYAQILEETGLTCSQRSLAELMNVELATTQKSQVQLIDDRSNDGKIYISVCAPSEEIGNKILAVLDAHVQEACAQIAQTAEGLTYEAVAQSGLTGYCGGVVSARQDGARRLATYLTTIANIEKNLNDDDKTYYSLVYGEEQELQKPQKLSIKWMALGAVILFILAGGCYALAFLTDGSVKDPDELEERFGLHLLARVETENAAKKKLRGLDKLLAEKPLYNDDAYLAAALTATGMRNITLSGDLQNAQIKRKMEKAAQMCANGGVKICDCFSVDAQAITEKTDGVVLFIQPWVTKSAQVLRELEICEFNEMEVVGFVAVG